MPKRISQDELNIIIKAIAAFPEGVGVKKIEDALDGKVPRRTLQRRLARLIEQKRIMVEGRARASRYHLPIVTGGTRTSTNNLKESVRSEIYIPTSTEGKALKEAIRQPIQNRHPVGYNRAFLDSYKPNESFYLTTEIRRELNDMGRSPESQRPAGTYVRQIFTRLLIDLSWNSSRLEGNTYSLLETERLLEQGEAAEGRNAMEAQMILKP